MNSTSTTLGAVSDEQGGTTRTASNSGGPPSDPPSSSPASLQYRDRARYKVIGEHGRGGLGRVVRAHDVELGRDVAVKELLDRNLTAELRFFREALVTARLEHPGIVPVHEAGRWADGTPFYAMKLVGGRPLKVLLDERPTVAERLALLPNVLAVADAIAYAHDNRIIHRDLKPSNVMVGEFGETIVIDWGLAKALDDPSDTLAPETPYRTAPSTDLTGAGDVLGTPAYMAPEQYGGRVDHRADIYALGGILHHVLTGVPPNGTPKADGRSLPAKGVPEDLIAVAARAMAKDPGARYPTTRAFADDLRSYMRHERVAARRYSLSARLALAFARHRTVALVLLAALVALTVTLAISVFNIARERASALDARQAALVSSAEALLSRDPTRAWKSLDSALPDMRTSMLRARIQAAGVADSSTALSGRLDALEVVAGGDKIAISTGDRRLGTLDSRTREWRSLASDLTEPGVFASTVDRIYFVQRRAFGLVLASIPLSGGEPTVIARLSALPRDLEADENAVYWLTTQGDLYTAQIGHPPGVIKADVKSFLLLETRLVICTNDGVVRIGPHNAAGDGNLRCENQRLWMGTGDSFVSADDDGEVQIYKDHTLRTVVVPSGHAPSQIKLSSSELVAAIGSGGEPLILRPGADAFEHLPLPSHPVGVSVYESLAAWSFLDGSVVVVDTSNGGEWMIQAHPGEPWSLRLLANHRLLTSARSEIRLWTLPASAPQFVAELPAPANNVVFNRSGDALLDDNDGFAYLIRHAVNSAEPVNKHGRFAFGVAWCGTQACSGGWDGKVICADVTSGVSHVAIDLHSIPPWLSGGSDHCVTAALMGKVYDLSTSAVAPIYEHRHEPYRFAASAGGKYIASGDWGGDVIVYDKTLGHIVAVQNRHLGLVSNVAWLGDELVTSGVDGILETSTPFLVPIRRWNLGSPIRYLDAANGSVGAGLDDGSLWFIPVHGTGYSVSTGAIIGSIAISASGKVLAAGTAEGEVIVLTEDHRAAAARFDRGRISCLGFESESSLFVCTASGRVMRIPLRGLSFQPLESNNEKD